MLSPSPELNIARRPLSRLTYRILSLNLIIVAVLAMSFSYITQTRESLINNELDSFANESRLFAKSLHLNLHGQEATPSNLLKTIAYLNQEEDQKIWIFAQDGTVLAESGTLPLRKMFAESIDKDKALIERRILSAFDSLSVNFNLPPFPASENLSLVNMPKIQETIDGLNISAWSAPDGGLVLSSVLLLHSDTNSSLTLQLVRRNMELESIFSKIRIDVVRFALVSLLLTISFSLYLAGAIGHPLRTLATAAESFRLNKGRGIEIPDMSDRQDEIGELSHAIREMTEALRQRLTAIESFAADVAHELKNPLTSMRSAIETLPKVKNEKDRESLTSIIHHDLHRMDRLITDISQASRLDAELSRDILSVVDVREVLIPLVESHQHNHIQNTILLKGAEKPALVMGQTGRLAQVFDNLIANALSFSPTNKAVTITISNNSEHVKITVDDEGSGIPDNKLDKIFDRFYSERPTGESFGMHSGLGLSIARQIAESHNGKIYAENRKDEHGKTIGARFVVHLKKASNS